MLAQVNAVTAARAAAGIVGAISVAVLAGWALSSATLVTGGFPSLPASNPMTAVGLSLAGVALWAAAGDSAGARRLARPCAVALATLGAATLLEYAGWPLGLDTLLFADRAALMDPVHRGRMSLLSAGELVAIGGVFLLWDLRLVGGYPFPDVVLPVIAVVPLQALVGHVYGAPASCEPGAPVPMAVPTAVSLLLLTGGMAAARIPHGFGRALFGRAPGAAVARRLLAGTLLVIPFLGWVRLAGERNGWFSADAGVVLNTVTTMCVIVTIVLWATASIERSSATVRTLTGRVHVAEAQLRAVLEQMPVGVIIAEAPSGRFVAGNREIERLWGRPLVSSRNVADFAPWEGRHPDGRRYEQREWPLARAIARGEAVSDEEIAIRAADGTIRTLLVSAAPVRAEDGTIAAGVAVALDVSERRRLEEEREALRLQAEEALAAATRAAKVKDEFLATLSHELRTPLNAIIGWTHLLARGRVQGEAMRHALETIERNAHAQARLVEDLLDVSRIITGKLRLEIDSVDLLPIVHRALESLMPAADARNVRLEIARDQPAAIIRGDPHRLQQIVWNLVSNAVKFTPSGGHVAVRLARTETHVSLTVSDTGVGIAPEFLPHIFESFRQQNGAGGRAHAGLGLGLSIVRELVHLHGGTIEAHSEGAGRGASFTVTLPTQVSVATVDQRVAAPPDTRLHGLTVLAVDDDPDSLRVVAMLLGSHGARVHTASSATDALALMVSLRPDVLLADIGMPGQDGYALIARIRQLERSRGAWTPAVALTAYASAADRSRALTAGFQVHVAKPVNPDELVAVVARLGGRPAVPSGEGP